MWLQKSSWGDNHDRAVDYWALGILICEFLTGKPPFGAAGAEECYEIYNSILKADIEKVDFPRQVKDNAIDIVRKLCCYDPSQRLGYANIEDIKQHQWYKGFDWKGLEKKTLSPPFVPRIHSTNDTSNFDKYPPEEETPQEEISGWDEDF